MTFVGNHFITHYFYALLGVSYTLPVGPYSLNKVPIVMHLLTLAYFGSYHVGAAVLMRRLNFASLSLPAKVALVAAMAYITAILETSSISFYPHYVCKRGRGQLGILRLSSKSPTSHYDHRLRLTRTSGPCGSTAASFMPSS